MPRCLALFTKKSLASCTIRVDESRDYGGNFKRLKKSVFSYERFEVSKGEGWYVVVRFSVETAEITRPADSFHDTRRKTDFLFSWRMKPLLGEKKKKSPVRVLIYRAYWILLRKESSRNFYVLQSFGTSLNAFKSRTNASRRCMIMKLSHSKIFS